MGVVDGAKGGSKLLTIQELGDRHGLQALSIPIAHDLTLNLGDDPSDSSPENSLEDSFEDSFENSSENSSENSVESPSEAVRETPFLEGETVELPTLTEDEQGNLDRLKAGFLDWLTYPSQLTQPIRTVMVSPLLFLAGLYVRPVRVQELPAIAFSDEADGVTLSGSLDTLVFNHRLWVTIVESRRMSFSLETGISRTLQGMLEHRFSNNSLGSNSLGSKNEKPSYGLITTGGNFIFVKLVRDTVPKYGLSREFNLWKPGNNLYEVFVTLKQLRHLLAAEKLAENSKRTGDRPLDLADWE